MKNNTKSNINLDELSNNLIVCGMKIIGNLEENNDLDDVRFMATSLGYYYAIVHKQLSSLKNIEDVIKDSMLKLIVIVSKKEGYENFEYKILESYNNCFESLKRKRPKKKQTSTLSKLYLKDLYGEGVNKKGIEEKVDKNLLILYNNTNSFIIDNIKNQKNINDTLLKSAIWIVFVQILIYLISLITNNLSFDSKSDILKFTIIHVPLIIAVIFMILRKKNLRNILHIKSAKVGIILIIIFLIVTLMFGIFNISISKANMEKLDEMIFGPRCENGFDYINNQCVKDVTVNSNIVYECTLSNYQLEGDQCVRYYNAGYFDECPMGYLSWLGYCKKIGASTNYSKCGSGSSYYYFDDMCYPNLPITRKYYCSGGMLLGDKCRQTAPALMNYECPLGYNLSFTDNTCIKTIKKKPLR
jgi:hypothetical protein